MLREQTELTRIGAYSNENRTCVGLCNKRRMQYMSNGAMLLNNAHFPRAAAIAAIALSQSMRFTL